MTLAATNGSAGRSTRCSRPAPSPNTLTAAGEPVLMTAARTGNADAVQMLARPRRRRQRARALVRRDGADVGGGREPRRRSCRRCSPSRAPTSTPRSTMLDAPVLEFPRSGGPNSPFPRGGWTPLMFAARDRGDRCRARAGRARRRPERGGAAADRRAAQARGARRAPTQGVGTTALVFAIINSHYDLAAMLLEKGANPNVAGHRRHGRALRGRGHEQPAVGAGPAGADPHRQARRGRPGEDAARKGRQPERAAEARAAEAPPRRRHDAEFRRGRDAADARGAHQRRGGR